MDKMDAEDYQLEAIGRVAKSARELAVKRYADTGMPRLESSFDVSVEIDFARVAIAAMADDPDIQEILRWLDFKSCGWHPDEQTYIGARKLLAALKPDFVP